MRKVLVMVPDDSVFGDARFAVYRGPPHQWGDFVRVFLRLKSCIKLDTFIYYMTSRLKNTPCSYNEFMNQRLVAVLRQIASSPHLAIMVV